VFYDIYFVIGEGEDWRSDWSYFQILSVLSKLLISTLAQSQRPLNLLLALGLTFISWSKCKLNKPTHPFFSWTEERLCVLQFYIFPAFPACATHPSDSFSANSNVNGSVFSNLSFSPIVFFMRVSQIAAFSLIGRRFVRGKKTLSARSWATTKGPPESYCIPLCDTMSTAAYQTCRFTFAPASSGYDNNSAHET